MIDYLGFHASISSATLYEDCCRYKEEGYGLIQIFLGNPRSLNGLKYHEYKEVQPRKLPLDVIVHGPYTVSLVTDMGLPLWGGTLSYMVNQAKICHHLGIKNLVTHVGGRQPYQDMRSAYNSAKEFCTRWLHYTEGLDIVLCIENDAGSKNGRKVGSITFLYKLIKEMNHPRIRMTFDTEHAFANGFDLTQLDKVDKILEVSNVVHLNGIPANVERGGHLDRHSETLIKDSKNGPDEIMHIARKAYDLGIPMILERKGKEIIEGDMKYVSENIGETPNIVSVDVIDV